MDANKGQNETDSRKDDRDFKLYEQYSHMERQIITQFKNSVLMLENYSIDAPYLGKVIIFNHNSYSKEFHPDAKPPGSRYGTERDVKRLGEVFSTLNCTPVDIYQDKTEKEIEDILKRASQFNYSEYSCVIIVVLSHGDEHELYAYDKKYDAKNLWKSFTKSSRPNKTLAGKPKIFIIQACRGSELDIGQYIPDCVPDGAVSPKMKQIPMCADLFIAYSSFLGYKSIRHTELGSWFIQTLCDCIEQFKEEQDLVGLLTIVQHHIANTKVYKGHKKQIPCIESTLTKRFFLSKCKGSVEHRQSSESRISWHHQQEQTDTAEKNESQSIALNSHWFALAITATVITTFFITKTVT